ncbi:uncharacterized protein PHACADRAFT_197746 [Phanerochaete carnosa HHB-10118-sp]|uniref:F-box domain-containing protein n=1 Tax=Phanerochaete carnosa (strain HHB-10118-sp) TaxID=650164 RepID=K5W341_PHACS|nr:uncharacterized protein PHACADRAFT_197746 [Phanerochaete carnosa HHB-10118-sp]EKM53314.1 hypothetical protein PHACADRAFT_197746 [Phanerochaete carnosa HHB-10118-sp]
MLDTLACPATYRCLAIVEILRRIVGFTTEDTLHTVAVLSRTSRLFHDVAQEAVWEDQATLLNLFHCLPGDVWDDTRELCSFLRPPNPSEWKRVMANAALVKSLKLESNDCGLLGPDWGIIALHCPEKVLFPNLKELEWEDNDDCEALSHAHLLLGPKLRNLALKLGADAHVSTALERLTSLLDTVACQRPPLRELYVPIETGSVALCKALGKVIQSVELETFESTVPLTQEQIIAVAKSRSLEIVDLHCTSSLDINDEVFNEEGVFPAIAALYMSVKSLELHSVRRLFLDASSPDLGTIHLKCTKDPREETLVEFLEGLAKRPSAFHMRSLELVFAKDAYRNSPPPAEQPEHVLGPRVLAAAFALKSLTQLRIKSRNLDIDDETVHQIVLNLPQLQSLLLLPTWYSGRPSKFTFRAIALAASGLPCLKELGLPLNIEGAHFPVPYPNQWYNQSCTKLYVADSPLTDERIEDVAVFLSMWFWYPELQIIACETGVPGDRLRTRERGKHKAAWEKCQKLLRPLSRARYQERFRYGLPDAPWTVSYSVPLLWRAENDKSRHLPLIPQYSPTPL